MGPTSILRPTRRPRFASTDACSSRTAAVRDEGLVYSVLTDTQKKREETLELDFSFGIRGLAASSATSSTSAAPWARSTVSFPKIRSFGT
jgi:hypothetical protein